MRNTIQDLEIMIDALTNAAKNKDMYYGNRKLLINALLGKLSEAVFIAKELERTAPP